MRTRTSRFKRTRTTPNATIYGPYSRSTQTIRRRTPNCTSSHVSHGSHVPRGRFHIRVHMRRADTLRGRAVHIPRRDDLRTSARASSGNAGGAHPLPLRDWMCYFKSVSRHTSLLSLSLFSVALRSLLYTFSVALSLSSLYRV